MSGRFAELTDVDFRYSWRRQVVLRGINWSPRLGRTILLGPNGAGKSTLLRLCAGLLNPSSGDLRTAKPLRETVGYMPQSVKAVRGLTSQEQVAYSGWLQGQTKPHSWARARECLDHVGLADRANHRAHTLSGGQLRRLGLAESLIAEPQTLILDEPTVGLDPRERSRFRSILDNVKATTIIVSTHQVDDLINHYEHVVLMKSGQLVYESSAEDFVLQGTGQTDVERAESAYNNILHGDEL